jgi:hypothetical protein
MSKEYWLKLAHRPHDCKASQGNNKKLSDKFHLRLNDDLLRRRHTFDS